MSNNSNFVSQKIGGVTYSLRKAPTLTSKNVIGTSLSLFVMVPFMVFNSLYQMVFPASRSKIQAAMVPKLMAGVEKEFQDDRAQLLDRISGRVLDFGAGTGPYLKYCEGKAVAEVVAVEPLTDLHDAIQKSGSKLQKLTIINNLSELPTDEKFDWVILGNVLCEVDDQSHTLHEIDALLKPGGMVYFSEHIASAKGSAGRVLQELMNPLWHHFSGACNCNRETIRIMETSSDLDWQMIYWTFHHFHLFFGPFVLGLAQKKKVN